MNLVAVLIHGLSAFFLYSPSFILSYLLGYYSFLPSQQKNQYNGSAYNSGEFAIVHVVFKQKKITVCLISNG